jgi:hypothetical protein
MASSARLELLAYFLGMARAESEMFVRTNADGDSDSDGENGYAAGSSESGIPDTDTAQ